MESTTAYIADAFTSRNDGLADLYDKIEDPDREDAEGVREELDDFALSAEVERHLVVTISTGGPHEEIDAVIDERGNVISATFNAYWGSDKRETRLDESDALYRYVAELAELHD